MRFRSGSALLVVLGMLSFMIISGLAFSVYMRATRLPSSFTRRTAATRQLAKAALVEAIDQIDLAIANDPHPNVRRGANDSNYWLGRVMIAEDRSKSVTKLAKDVVNDIESDPEAGGCRFTVPVLSFEALAYIPPPLINEVRYYGQRTPTAAWHTFDFDAGRYAFVAVDVSDYLDVNRLVADEGRSSNPGRRVTYSYAFDTADHSRWQGGADQWDSFMDQFRSINDDGTFSFGSKVPLVSLADLALAFGQSDIGGLRSPFYQYLKSGGSGNGFYGAAPGGENFEKYAEMTFVTDSLDAPLTADEKQTATGKQILDLDDENNQPFTESELTKSQSGRTVSSLRNVSFKSEGLNYALPTVAKCALSDYLDKDRIPISLGIPSVERVPMICGIKPTVAESPTAVKLLRVIEENSSPITGTEGQTQTIVKECTVHWRLDPTTFRDLVGGGAGVSVLVVYPFRNHEKKNEGSYFHMDGRMQFFLSTAPMPLRTENSGDLLRFNADDSEHVTPGDVQYLCSQAKLVQRAVFEFPLRDGGGSAKGLDSSVIPYADIKEAKDCVSQQTVDLEINRSSAATLINDELKEEKGDVLRVTYRWTLTGEPNPNSSQGGPAFVNYKPQLSDFQNGIPELGYANADVKISPDKKPESEFLPLKADGMVDDTLPATVAAAPGADISLYLNVAATVRVTSHESSILGSAGWKTLDMVPATAWDDEKLNNVRSSGRMQNIGGMAGPLMKFVGSAGILNAQKSEDVTWNAVASPQAVMVDDPRYNHAPENWKTLATFTRDGWLDAQSSGNADRDGDIFMASSDQGYLQSVYELAFLPRLSHLNAKGGDWEDDRGYLGEYDGNGRTELGVGTQPDAGLMWRTYDVVGRYDVDTNEKRDDFEGLGLENRGRGLRVNPYSDSTNVIMAALANAPRDWRVASDPEDTSLNPAFGLDAKAFNEKYAWNEYSSGGKLSWPALSAVAGDFMTEVRALAGSTSGDLSKNWKKALRNLFDNDAQSDTAEYLCGVKLADYPPESGDNAPIYSVDKKFLYGFWRGCFSARQQLFLVFVRAEPMMLGGGVAGVTPPQLGAKAVAVVWRNPNRTNGSDNNNGTGSSSYVPHPTRILFYKQFE